MENSSITVTGRGDIHVVPDVTRLEINISSVFSTYQDAYKRAKTNVEWMTKILEYNNLNGQMAKTLRLDISDHTVSLYDKSNHYIGSKKEGYELSQKLKVDLGMDNVLLNKIVKGVGKFIEDAQINIGYTVKDPRPSKLKMLERAVKDARDKAQIMAAAAGCKLTDVISINYSHEELHIYSQARNIHSNSEAKCCMAESLDITPDDLAIGDEVTVVWGLEDQNQNVNL